MAGERHGMCESAFNMLYRIMDFWNPTPCSLADTVNISEEPSVFIYYPGDGGSMSTPPPHFLAVIYQAIRFISCNTNDNNEGFLCPVDMQLNTDLQLILY
jgi:hypothetical protein